MCVGMALLLSLSIPLTLVPLSPIPNDVFSSCWFWTCFYSLGCTVADYVYWTLLDIIERLLDWILILVLCGEVYLLQLRSIHEQDKEDSASRSHFG